MTSKKKPIPSYGGGANPLEHPPHGSSFRDCVWYGNHNLARFTARERCDQAAEPLILIHDMRTDMMGVGVGDSEPSWCKRKHGFQFAGVVRPKEN